MINKLWIFAGSITFLGLLITWIVFGSWPLSAPPSEQILGSDFKVHVVSYLHSQTPEKTIIIVPPTGGINLLDKLYAFDLWQKGHDVHILTAWPGSDEIAYDLGIHQRFYSGSRKAIGIVMDHIKSPFIGLLGTSVGGLHTAVAMGTHDRLNAALVITAGAPITEVVVNSDQEAMKLLKKKRYEMYGFKNDGEYLEALNKALQIDPFELPRKFEGKKLGVVLAENDLTVPTLNQQKLKDLWKAQEVIMDSSDHFYTIVRTGLFRRKKIVDFFD